MAQIQTPIHVELNEADCSRGVETIIELRRNAAALCAAAAIWERQR
jgi:hypothetical protein